jgi:CRISPR type III-B/RAMP module RAMP protein Cmr6
MTHPEPIEAEGGSKMAYYPLPKKTAAAVITFCEEQASDAELRKKQASRCHPGLLLDRFVAYADSKFITSYEQTDQKEHLDCVVEALTKTGKDTFLSDLNSDILKSEWDELAALVVDGHDGHAWRQKTIWRLAAHLSRATAVENASLCLHPIYGFPYLPATGLKGLAHAYAALEEADAEKKERLEAIFGSQSAAGTVLFLDAWPEIWPEAGPTVEVDILNNHHREYYVSGGQSGEAVSAPGDWENPVPVYFLAVAPDTGFRFCVAKLTEQTSADDVCLAAKWLQKGLQMLGAGAKTAAGYGYFGEPESYASSS